MCPLPHPCTLRAFAGVDSTAAVGKWHLGSFSPRTVPTGCGFDTYVGYYGGVSQLIDCLLSFKLVTALALQAPADGAASHAGGGLLPAQRRRVPRPAQ